MERRWHYGMLWQTERISAYRFCQIVSVHFIIFKFLTKTYRRATNEGEYLAVNKPLMSENLISYALTLLISAKKGGNFHPKICYSNYICTLFQPPLPIWHLHTIYLMLSSLDVNIFICRRLQSSAKSTLPNFQKENT